MTSREVDQSALTTPPGGPVFELTYLALRSISKSRAVLTKNWGSVMSRFPILL